MSKLLLRFLLFPVFWTSDKSWSLVCFDNKNLSICYYNYLNKNNTEEVYHCINNFIALQLRMEKKIIKDTSYRQISYKDIRGDGNFNLSDSGVFMLRQALNISVGKSEEFKPELVDGYRIELLTLLYEYGKL